MKKILTVLFALTLSVCMAFAFGACNLDDLLGKNKDGTSEEGTYYKVEVKDDGNFLYEPLKNKYKAGTEVEIKIGMVTDIGVYVFVNDERINQSGYDIDNYYWIYKFTMPEEDITVLITSDAWHGIEICDFKDAFYWLNYFKTEDVIKIKCESGYIGVSPDTPSNIKYTTDKTDIENICAVFNCKLKPCANPHIAGGSSITYTFYTADDQFELLIDNGYAVKINFTSNEYFEIIGFRFPELTNPEQ